MPLHLHGLRFKLLLESFEICDQVADQLIILLKQKLKLHHHVYLLNMPRKKTFLKHELQLSICVLGIVYFEIPVVVCLPIVCRNTMQETPYVPALILLGCID